MRRGTLEANKPVVPSPAAFADFVERTDRDGGGYRNLSDTHWFREFDESVVLDYLNGKPRG
jgi:hypothetical protein